MPVGRHRHAVNVRADGLASVLGPLLREPGVSVALLVDADSGMVLDACGPAAGDGADLEQLGAAHGDLVRLALGPAAGLDPAGPAAGDCELVVTLDGGRHLVVRRIPDPHGDRLALSVLVTGPPRVLRRTRRRLREVSAAALTAGPTTTLRPVEGAWVPGPGEERPLPPPRPRLPARPTPSTPPVRPPAAVGSALAALDMPRLPSPSPGVQPELRARPELRVRPELRAQPDLRPVPPSPPAPPAALPPPASPPPALPPPAPPPAPQAGPRAGLPPPAVPPAQRSRTG